MAQSSLWTNLVAYWPMDTTDGVTTPDLALGNSMFLVNAPSLVAGQRGNCFQFNGSSQYLNVTHSTNFLATGLPIYTTNGYTVAFWVKGTSTQSANHIPFSENAFSGSMLWDFNTRSTKIAVFLRNNAGTTVINNVQSATAVFDAAGSTWHHVAFTDANGTCKLYIDGNLDSANVNYTAPSAGAPAATITAVGDLIRANNANNLWFNGSVDEVMAWSRVLSQSEIQNAMNNGIPTPIPPTPPTILAQPANQTNSLGDRVIFSANIFGNQPMTYQWLSNGVPIPGETNSSLTLNNLTSPGTNFYSVTAANIAGTNTSASAALVVLPDPAPNIISGMVSYWPLNTISNSTSTPDLVSQNDLQLTAMSNGNLVPGKFGNGLSFDGSSQYGAETTGTPIYDLNTTYTVALWINGVPGIANEQIFANGNSTNGNYFFIGPDNTGATSKLDIRINPGMSDTLSTATALDGTWHHVVWVDQNGTGLLYIDGVLDPSVFSYGHGALGSVLLNNTTIGALVANPLRDFFNGAIDDVGTWSRRLTYTEIQSIFTNGIPTPPVIIKPSVTSLTTQPGDPTNGVYQGDTVSFTVVATGTTPLSYQWRKNGAPVSSVTNPSAVSNVFTLAKVQPADAGSYTVVITNSGGAVTSSIVQLTVIPYIPATNGTVLQVEFNWAPAPAVQSGFSSMTLNVNPATFSGPEVTLSTIGATFFSDRSRSVPVNNPPNLTQANLYQQFIFSTANTPGTGIDILLQRLAPNTTYGLTLWSYDNANNLFADWTEVSSGTPVTVQTGYIFTGSSQPTADYQDTLGTLLTSSTNGQLEIQGVVDSGTAGIFINALRLVANPTIQITDTRVVADGNLQITVMAQYPNQTLEFQESADLTPGSWTVATDIQSTVTHGPVVIVEVPLSTDHLFYRARATSP
ncbi:LamG-like jellyroll fold domain-containing protein [Pedosphaera parvula]|nr:LamG-like jellyroll fold domain-containing protein [Pedosphaera parvula]